MKKERKGMQNSKKVGQRAKRFLASLLAGAMIVSSLPVAAFADDGASTKASASSVHATTGKTWQFTYFGTSSSSTANTVGSGADINKSVTLNSCTYKADGTINAKGGKFVADSPADGMSYYYTTIDPTKENFYLQADVTIDYINPSPDGQEGFALMLRDTISGSGSYYSNLVSVTGTKLPINGVETKDVVGVRNYTGVVSNEVAESNSVVATRDAFTVDTSDTIKQGATYRVSLEKTSNAYISTQYTINADGTNGEVIGQYIQYIAAKNSNATSVKSYSELDDPMTTQESNVAYLALVTARGVNATFSNIVFSTSEWKASDWEVQPTTYTDLDASISSPSTCAESSYELVFKANADGVANIYANGELVDSNVSITANTAFSKSYAISGDTEFKVEFTPNADFAFSLFEKLSSYDTVTKTKNVSYKTYGQGDTIYVAPNGKAANNGTSYEDAIDLQTALNYASAGQTILLATDQGDYEIDGALTVQRGRDGNEAAPITMTTESGYATINFGGKGTGFTVWGNYWNISKINITRTADGNKGMQLSGSNCVLESMNFYNNGNTGLQISGLSSETKNEWPSNNLVKNCTSMNNADRAEEDADGFAAKITVGDGNVFDGCISAYNADDGWDLFAKAATGSIGSVTIQNCVTYKNGYIKLAQASVKKQAFVFPTIICDPVTGTLSYGDDAVVEEEAGNGNGFKMGGTNLTGGHVLTNSISYENKAKGIDSNSCPDIKVSNSTSYNNGSYNVALYTGNKSATTAFEASGILSFRNGTSVKEQIAPQSQSSKDLTNSTNFYWDTDTNTSHNSASNVTTVEESWFESLDTSVQPTRNEDGSIDMHGLLLLSATGLAASEAGARGEVWGQSESTKATIWVVGDSTVSGFTDKYYLPREGYGEELSNYLNADVYNLAVSGASSKDFTGMTNYTTLINGSDKVPALSDSTVEGDKFLIIGFGHNDEKTETARYTNPNGDYKTEGSFANSLYVNYIAPALAAGVTPVVVTPLVRLTTANTVESYNSASGHITTTTTASGVTYEGGDYAQAIRDMCKELGIDCIDLTAASIAKNVELGDDAQWLHAFTGAKLDEDDNLVATGLDTTHTNSYGAKMNAWLIATLAKESGSKLGNYSKNKAEPTYADCFADAVNPDYEPSNYKAPTTVSERWATYTDADGIVWQGSAFGNIGGADKLAKFSSKVTEDSLTMAVTGNAGKIASTVDGLMMYFVQLPAGSTFTLTATATVNKLDANNQVSFGLMARDDMYIDTSISDTIGDYVAVGTRNQGKINCFGRKSGALYDGPEATATYAAGSTVELKLVGTSDGFTLTYGDNETVSAGFDYALTSIDSDYIYVGFYVARNADVTFTNIKLEGATPTKGVLTGLEVEGTLEKTEYLHGETVDTTGLTATASYISGATEEVELVGGTVSVGDTTATVSYTENGATKTATIEGITVKVAEITDTDEGVSKGELTTVPDSLTENEELNTVDKIEEALKAELDTIEAEDEEKTTDFVYDVKLSGSNDYVVTKEDMKDESGKLAVTIAYPEGTNKNYSFTVAHMITMSGYENVGTVEVVEDADIVKGENGITFQISGLSPIMVRATAPAEDAAIEGGSGLGTAIAAAVVGGAVVGGVIIAKNWDKLPIHKLSGTVTDAAGAALAGVTVTLKQGDKVVRTVKTNKKGVYTLRAAKGEYTLVVSSTDPATGKTVSTEQTVTLNGKDGKDAVLLNH
jgi:hypothetical protein